MENRSQSENWLQREAMLIGAQGIERLKGSSIAVVGIGGVGCGVVEALARAGVGKIILMDFDFVSTTNLNRQIGALHSTLERNKAQVMGERAKDINPDAEICVIQERYNESCRERLFDEKPGFIADAIDMVTDKLDLIEQCVKRRIGIISAMGTGNKLYPELLEVSNIKNTKECPLARVMRRELKQRGIENLPVVYSGERPSGVTVREESGRNIPGSISFVPPVAGMLMAGYIIRSIACT